MAALSCLDTKNREGVSQPISMPLLGTGDQQRGELRKSQELAAAPAVNKGPSMGAFNANEQEAHVQFTTGQRFPFAKMMSCHWDC